MKSILALSLLAASFAFVPSAAAECDPTNSVCADSFGYGDCASNGYAYNYAQASAQGNFVYAQTYCDNYPGIYSVSSVFVYADTPAGYGYAEWYGVDYWGWEYCGSYAYTSAAGYTELPLCEVVGWPPTVPALLP